MRRGAAYPAERPSSYPARQQAASRRQLAPPPSRHGRQALQALSTGTPLGSPARGRWAWWPRRCGRWLCLRQPAHFLGQRPASSVRCGHPISTRVCPRGRCPESGAGVRCPGVPASAVSDRGGRRGGWRLGRQPRGRNGRGRRARPPCPRPVRRNRGIEAAQAVLGQGGVGLDSAVVVGAGGVVARSTAWPTRIGRMRARIASWWRAGVRSEVTTTLRGHHVRQGRVAWSRRASWAGLRLAHAAVLRPRHAVSGARSNPTAL
jgi:hypothetical protein